MLRGTTLLGCMNMNCLIGLRVRKVQLLFVQQQVDQQRRRHYCLLQHARRGNGNATFKSTDRRAVATTRESETIEDSLDLERILTKRKLLAQTTEGIFDHLRGREGGRSNLMNAPVESSQVAPTTSSAAVSAKRIIYTGFDPTASSLHVGNLLTIICLFHFLGAGHKVILLVGGATGSIGDPSGKSQERVSLPSSIITKNSDDIEKQLHLLIQNATKLYQKRITSRRTLTGDGNTGKSSIKKTYQFPSKEKIEELYKRRNDLPSSDTITYTRKDILHQEEFQVDILNNLEWTKDISLLDFLSGVGKLSRVSVMLARDSVKERMSAENSEGISFTEFTYQLLQAHDFLHLHKNFGCTIQLGGSDQWGNIVSGTDLIRKTRNATTTKNMGSGGVKTEDEEDSEMEAHGITIPLVTTTDGQKFGKSEGNALWLNKSLLSSYDFYQYYLRNVEDDAVEDMLLRFTFLEVDVIERKMKEHKENPELRLAQKLLALEVTELVHGSIEAENAQVRSALLFEKNSSLSVSLVEQAFKGDADQEGNILVYTNDKEVMKDIVKLTLTSGLLKSRTSVLKMIKSGGLYLNNAKWVPADASKNLATEVSESLLIEGRMALLRSGKTNYRIVILKSTQ